MGRHRRMDRSGGHGGDIAAWEEMSDFHARLFLAFGRQLFGEDLATEAGTFIWVLIASR